MSDPTPLVPAVLPVSPDMPDPHRMVLVDFTFRVAVAVPQDWTPENIDFHYNDGTACVGNVVYHLDQLSENPPEHGPGCLCPSMTAAYFGEYQP